MVQQASRRVFLASAVGFGAGAVVGRAQNSPAAAVQGDVIPVPEFNGRPVLFRGGCVLSLDPAIGDFDAGDVLVEGSKIRRVGRRIDVSDPAIAIIDATNRIVMPGFVDTHRHMWQGPLRSILPNGLLSDYGRDITGVARSVYRPQDAFIGDLITAYGAIHAGITTILDWSHIGNTPEHTDAAIQGLRESGIRGVYGFGPGGGGQSRFPQDIRRLRSQFFNTPDQLLTLALATGLNPADWALARDTGASISVHVNGANQLLAVRDIMGPDVTCIHCPNLTEMEWRIVKDSGAHVSIACPIEMEMGHGVPPIQQALDHGIRPSLSTDVETQMAGDFFTQMRSVFTLQRMLLLARGRAGQEKLPPLLTVRQVLEFATIQGAIDNGLEKTTGSLTPGKEADILLLRTDDINVAPVNNAYGAVVLSMDTSNVDSVFIGGKVRKWQGKLVGVDTGRIVREAAASRDAVLAKAGWKPTLLGRDIPGQ
jgi:cytosine/adenosine deaminase-related metal-dependent hydrolase